MYEDIIATTYIDGCAPAFYLDSGAVVLSKATTPEVTAYRQQYVYDQLKEIAEKFDISSLTVSKTETDAETTLIFSDGTNTKSIAVSKLQPSDEQINAAISDWMDKNALPVEVWSKNVLNINDENVSMGYIANAGQINSSDSYWVSGYIPAKQGDVLRSSLNGAAANFYYVAEYDSAKGFLTRASKSANTYTVTNGSTAYIRVSWKTSLVSYKNEKAMLTLNNADLSFEEYGSHMEGGLGIITGPQGPAGADGKSAYAYAVDGGYTGTEAEFAAKLAQEKYANPNALTFTGAVTGSYDGSAAVSVEIPSGGGSGDVNHALAVEVLASGTVNANSTDAVNTGVTLYTLKQYKLFLISVSGASNTSLKNWYTKVGNISIGRVNNFRAQTILYEFLNDEKTLMIAKSGTSGNHGVYLNYLGKATSYGVVNAAMFADCVYDLSSLSDDTPVITYPTGASIDINWSILGVTK